MKIKNLPNILSCIRILLVFVFAGVFFYDYPNNVLVALFVFLLAGATDIADGIIARNFNCISNIGKILDPLADKMMQCTVMICLMFKNIIPLWFGIPFILKEFVILVAGLFFYKSNNVVVVSKWYGKFAVCFFYATIALIVIFGDFFKENPIYMYILCALALIITIFALIMYILSYSKVYKELSVKKKSAESSQ